MPAFVQPISHGPDALHHKLAVGVDVRNRAENLNRLPEILAELARTDIGYRLVFLDTRDDVLIKRYSETRRRHPLSGDGLALADAIAEERRLLKPMLAIADRVVDTSDLNVHQLRRLVITEMGLAARRADACCSNRSRIGAACRPMRISCSTRAACPIRIGMRNCARSRARTRRCANGSMRSPRSPGSTTTCALFWQAGCRASRADGRSYVTICIGCTGGRHRSVYLAEQLAEHFRQRYAQVLTYHREME